VLRYISVLGCVAFAAPCVAQEPTNVVLFLKSPYYAEVDPSLARSTGEKSIDSSWCRPGASLATFPWADELASVGRGNTPVPLIHAILADRGGACEYFVVYMSIYAVSPSLGKKLAAWEPALSVPRDDRTAATAARPQSIAAAPPAPATPVVQPEEQDLRETAPPPLPRPKPQLAAARRIAASAKPKAPLPGLRPLSPPASR
jgi:hypothetical protein